MNSFKKKLLQDLVIIILSICFAVLLVKTEIIHQLLFSSYTNGFFESLIAGLFFTSIFTTAPAMVALGEISQVVPILHVAFFGALGALMGDLILFKFIRDRFSDDIAEFLRKKKEKKVKVSEHFDLIKWFSFFIGCLIIASPLPDELGIGLLGFTKVKMKLFIPISYIFNFAGIVLIGLIANSV